MEIRHYTTASELLHCFDLMSMLRPNLLSKEAFIVQVQRQQQQGYKLLGITEGIKPCALVGYRCLENFIHGRFCYVDDLITDTSARKNGYAKELLESLNNFVFEKGGSRIVLDTAITNNEAQQFYQKIGFNVIGFHLYRDIY